MQSGGLPGAATEVGRREAGVPQGLLALGSREGVSTWVVPSGVQETRIVRSFSMVGRSSLLQLRMSTTELRKSHINLLGLQNLHETRKLEVPAREFPISGPLLSRTNSQYRLAFTPTACRFSSPAKLTNVQRSRSATLLQ